MYLLEALQRFCERTYSDSAQNMRNHPQ